MGLFCVADLIEEMIVFAVRADSGQEAVDLVADVEGRDPSDFQVVGNLPAVWDRVIPTERNVFQTQWKLG